MFEAACFVKLCQQRNVVFETLSTESHRKKLVDFNRSFESLVQRLTFQSSVQTLEVVKDISADLQMVRKK